jgi:radical SAM superfamily enzyme YgiQ (UPF0313 family)
MRCPVAVRSTRRILCVFPAYSPSFGTFSHAYALIGRVRAFMPPQGLLVIAAYLPERWQVRFIDENIQPATGADFAWADAVLVSGMHIQRQRIRDICARAKTYGKLTVLGGPSVSGAPEDYPEFDYLHLGEIGDGTDRLVGALDDSVAPPPAQVRYETAERLPLDQFPTPAYHLVPLDRYFILSVQFSSGCPYRCEFCDIPVLYGRQPRLKTPAQVLAELDALRAQDGPPTVYFVDDNFIGNKKATKAFLPHLVAWQRRHGYPLRFACEATVNLAGQPEILSLMREAGFVTVFVGIETPDIEALKRIDKGHNASVEILEAIATLNRYGLEVVSGIILGLDSDTPATAEGLLNFIAASQIPVLTINLMQALPKTPLWERLAAAGRLIDEEGRESNVRFLRAYDEVIADWRRCVGEAYAPAALFARFLHQLDATYNHRLRVSRRGQLTLANLGRGLRLAFNLTFRVGLKGDYRRHFWRAMAKALARGDVEAAFTMGLVAHHMITFSREALAGETNASFYATHSREAHTALSLAPSHPHSSPAGTPLVSAR